MGIYGDPLPGAMRQKIEEHFMLRETISYLIPTTKIANKYTTSGFITNFDFWISLYFYQHVVNGLDSDRFCAPEHICELWLLLIFWDFDFSWKSVLDINDIALAIDPFLGPCYCLSIAYWLPLMYICSAIVDMGPGAGPTSVMAEHIHPPQITRHRFGHQSGLDPSSRQSSATFRLRIAFPVYLVFSRINIIMTPWGSGSGPPPPNYYSY